MPAQPSKTGASKPRKRSLSVEEKAIHQNDARRQAGNTGGKRAAEHRKRLPAPRST